MPPINLNRESTKYGLMLGLFSTAVYLLTYVINPMLLVKWWLGIAIMVIFIVALVIICKAIRKANGGFISFGEMFQSIFIVMIVSSVISVGFQWILYKVIDPTLEETLRTALIENTSQWMMDWGMSDSEIEKATEGMQTQSFAPSIWSLLATLFGAGIFALIFAAIFKKKNKDADYEALLTHESSSN
jgi:hypothetical protein